MDMGVANFSIGLCCRCLPFHGYGGCPFFNRSVLQMSAISWIWGCQFSIGLLCKHMLPDGYGVSFFLRLKCCGWGQGGKLGVQTSSYILGRMPSLDILCMHMFVVLQWVIRVGFVMSRGVL